MVLFVAKSDKEKKEFINSFNKDEPGEMMNIGDKTLKRRDSPGMYWAEEILWSDPASGGVAMFYITSTEEGFYAKEPKLVPEAYEIINSFQFE